jgi:hypothetical protein
MENSEDGIGAREAECRLNRTEVGTNKNKVGERVGRLNRKDLNSYSNSSTIDTSL